MDRKNNDSNLLLEQVLDLLENNKVLELRELLEEYHIMDIFDVMEDLDEKMKVKLVTVDGGFGDCGGREMTYFEKGEHLDRWRYSPTCCERVIETVFDDREEAEESEDSEKPQNSEE